MLHPEPTHNTMTSNAMIDTHLLQKLQLEAPQASEDSTVVASFIGAASGLSRIGDTLFVVADDALHLGIFDATQPRPGKIMPLLPGALSSDPTTRKAQKPDFEVLTHWQDYNGAPGGALLALGSGSKKHRCKGVLIPLDTRGQPTGNPQEFDLAPLYSALANHLVGLNIEGAVITGNEVWLFQRGNSAGGKNAIVRTPIATLDSLLQKTPGRFSPVLEIVDIFLGDLHGVPLGFTDATLLRDEIIIFSAAAEDTADTYLDGKCTGSVIGMLEGNGTIKWQKALTKKCKIEGIAVREPSPTTLECLMVTDADDPEIAADLLQAMILLTP